MFHKGKLQQAMPIISNKSSDTQYISLSLCLFILRRLCLHTHIAICTVYILTMQPADPAAITISYCGFYESNDISLLRKKRTHLKRADGNFNHVD